MNTANTASTARTIWMALLTSVALYQVVLAKLLSVPAASAAPDFLQAASTIALALSAVQTVVIWRLRSSFDPTPDMPPPQRLQQVFTSFIVRCALAEAIALYGFVLAMLAREWSRGGLFFVWGAVLLILQRPRAEDFSLDIP